MNPYEYKISASRPWMTKEQPVKEPVDKGEVIDNCRIEELLGAGGFGAVYRATHVLLDQPRALKFMLISPDTREDARKRFFNEARYTARLKHGNIVLVHNVGEHRGMPFIHMEYLDGESLRSRLGRGPMTTGAALMIFEQVLEALASAHGRDIVHRDIKPENIMLLKAGGLKVVDFGLSLNIEVASGRVTTNVNATMGTPSYMAPEQWVSTSVTAAADLWSTGVILYECIARRRPFIAGPLPELMVKICSESHLPLHRARLGIPQEISLFVDSMLEKKPEKRAGSATQILKLFREGLRPLVEANPLIGELPPGLKKTGDGGDPQRFVRECDGSVMRLVDAQTFPMGTESGSADERPVHPVSLSAFLVDEASVSRLQFCLFLNLWGGLEDDEGNLMLDPEVAGIERLGPTWHPQGYEEEPITGICWFGARAYAEWAGMALPSEAQMELLMFNASPEGARLGASGLKYLVGQIRHWCADVYDEGFYRSLAREDPLSSGPGRLRSIRGFSNLNAPQDRTRFRRDFNGPSSVALDLGFRCVFPMESMKGSVDQFSRTVTVPDGKTDGS